MNVLDNTYGVGIANRFMLLEEETDDLDNGSFDEASFPKSVGIKPMDTIKAPLAKLHIDQKDVKIQNDRTNNKREDNKRYKSNDQAKEYQNEVANERRGLSKFGPPHDKNPTHDGPRNFPTRGGTGFRGRPFGNNRGVNRDRPRRDFDQGSDKMNDKFSEKNDSTRDNRGNSDDFKSPTFKETKADIDVENSQEWNKEELAEQFEQVPTDIEVEKKADQELEPENIPEVVQLTLDEWKAMQENTIVKPEYKLRKPGEGEDASKWKGTYILKKGDEEEEEEEYEEDTRHSGRTKNLLDIDITYRSPAARGRGGSGNRGAGFRMTRAFNSPAAPLQMRQNNGEFNNNFRGGPRGGGPGRFMNRRGGSGGFQHPRRPPNSNNQDSDAPTFNDEADFPSLRTITAK